MNASRRDIVARVLNGEEASVTTLASPYEMSFAAVQKHVAVLEDAGLVTKHRQGRERIVRGNPERIARARELLTRMENLWRARFSRLDAVLAEPDPELAEPDPELAEPDPELTEPDPTDSTDSTNLTNLTDPTLPPDRKE